MPVSCSKIEDGGVLLAGAGVLTDADIIEVNERLYATPQEIKGLRYQLCDFTRVEAIELTSQGIRRMSEQDRMAAEMNPGMVVAVAAEAEAVFGMARMWQLYSEESALEVAVLRSMEECREWIRARVETRR